MTHALLYREDAKYFAIFVAVVYSSCAHMGGIDSIEMKCQGINSSLPSLNEKEE